MKKMMLTLVLAIAASVWTMSEELCSISVPTPEAQNFYAQKGKMDLFPHPCNEGEECPNCMVVGMLIDNDTFYLANLSQNELVNYERYKVWYPMECTTLGAIFTYGNRNYIQQCIDNYYFPTGLTEGEYITVSGDINQNDWGKLSSCEDDNPCIPGTFLKLRANGGVYYLGTNDSLIGAQLDSIENAINSVNCPCVQPATISGTIYTLKGYKYINISNISISEELTQGKYQSIEWIKSLCNEWNIAKISGSTSPHEEIHTVKATLGADTIIETMKYAKLFEEGIYKGALREGLYRDIYYIPGGSTHEYLLYKFNANVGDTLSNLWTGGSTEWCPNGHNATVLSIAEGTPRIFTIKVDYIISDSEGDHIDPRLVYWTEGVGMSEGPVGMPCTAPYCACSCGQVVLCAYKDGKQIYTSELGKKYGCEYSYSDSIGEENQKLLGTWQIYKETLSGNEYNGQGELEYRTITQDVNDNYTYNFYDTKLLISCPTCFFFPKHYILTRLDDQMKWNLWVEDIFTLQNEPDSTYKYGQSTITIHELSENLIEWEYIAYDENKGPTTYYQYLKRLDTQGHDTIPLFVKDGPGTSTIDPVDPNLIYALLQGELLTIKDFSGAEIYCTLVNTTIPSNSPHHVRLQAQPFRDSLSVEITDAGLYEINLTSEAWNYSIYGSFVYGIKEGISLSTPEQPSAQKFVRNGQILILRGDKTYTLTGQEIK